MLAELPVITTPESLKQFAPWLPFNPTEASSVAGTVDIIFAIEVAIALFAVVVIAGTIIYFAIRYRRRSPDDRPPRIGAHWGIEAIWTSLTFLIFTLFFFMGAGLYSSMKNPPKHAEQIYIVAKQWMWKIQHADGPREINELHVPVGRPIQLIMTSQDVIHDFFVPAFRTKQDVLPGSYSTEWFVATRPGVYHAFCSQYCGANHALMQANVVVLTQKDYDAWRAGHVPAQSPESEGRQLFQAYGCASCHGEVAPSLAGLYGSQVNLQDGSTVTADEQYLRTSITNPSAQIVKGYTPIMPSYDKQLSPEQINSLVMYIKSLSGASKTNVTEYRSDGVSDRAHSDTPSLRHSDTTHQPPPTTQPSGVPVSPQATPYGQYPLHNLPDLPPVERRPQVIPPSNRPPHQP